MSFGALLGHFGALLAHLGVILNHFGRHLGPLGRPKGPPGRHKGSPWATLGVTWASLGVPRAPLGAILGPPCAGVPLPGAAIGHFGRPRRPLSSNLMLFCVILVAICVRCTIVDACSVHFRCILCVFGFSWARLGRPGQSQGDLISGQNHSNAPLILFNSGRLAPQRDHFGASEHQCGTTLDRPTVYLGPFDRSPGPS